MLFNKKILITNDDGIFSEGLKALTEEIYKITPNILIVAPAKEQSAVSHSMTIRRGLTLKKVNSLYLDVATYTLDGTPSDCIKVAYHYLNYHPDYVVSGINNGFNLGDDILYSGTVAACFEAYLLKVKSIAFSCDVGQSETKRYIKNVIDYIDKSKELSERMLLNVNIPLSPLGIKITKQGKNPYNTSYLLKDGMLYVEGNSIAEKVLQDENADVFVVSKGYISITPLTIDRTEY